MDSGNPTVISTGAVLLIRNGDLENARTLIDSLPADCDAGLKTWVRCELAWAEVDRNNHALARQDLDEAKRLDPEYWMIPDLDYLLSEQTADQAS